jgi:hypothetical protein
VEPKGEGCLCALGNHYAFVKELAALVVVLRSTALKHDEDAWQTVGVNRFLFAGRNCDIENSNCVILEKDTVVGRSSSNSVKRLWPRTGRIRLRLSCWRGRDKKWA